MCHGGRLPTLRGRHVSWRQIAAATVEGACSGGNLPPLKAHSHPEQE